MPEDGRCFVHHLECSRTGERLDPGRVWNLSPAGAPVLVRYDLDAIGRAVSRDEMTSRSGGFWRWRELLPLRCEADAIDLGEEETPLIALSRLGPSLGAAASDRLIVKDEGRLPTASFKARGLALAVAMARGFGVRRLAMPTNGNAGAAMAAYASRVGIEAHVFCPADTPEINVREISMLGAEVYRVDGLIDDCGRLVARHGEAMGWFDCSTLKEPYRIEGKKTMGLELAAQMGWRLPDVIFYPTGGGTGLIGMWKAFAELKALGWLAEDVPLPRMVAVQAAGCAPIVRAFEAGEEHAERWQEAATVAAGIRVPAAIGDFLILKALRESGGFAIAVEDEAILDARARAAAEEGVLLCPEGAATLAAWQMAMEAGLVSPEDRCVLFNCASGLKYPLDDRSRPYSPAEFP
ncbi:MAG: threonine synthase [Alphaproteobacteria bacterium]|nr:MAG: threonine synthase [Alphaproteobacteria bacterium]